MHIHDKWKIVKHACLVTVKRNMSAIDPIPYLIVEMCAMYTIYLYKSIHVA